MSNRVKSNLQTLKAKSLNVSLNLNGSQYRAIETLGCGAYGVVCSAINSKNNNRVAIKKIPDIFDNLLLAKRTYREIRILQHFKNENIIGVQDVFISSGAERASFRDVYIVFDYMETDLHQVISSKQSLSDDHIRYFLYQLLRGLKFIHSANILHRDLKPSNILVNENCDLKIGDFGMARPIASCTQDNGVLMSHYVATRWYRSPELMLFRIQYTTAVDIWSVGCIFAEMLGRKPIFPGRDLVHQVNLIFDVLGSPSENFINMAHTDRVKDFLRDLGQKSGISLDQKYPTAVPKAVRLLSKMLKIDPEERISVDDALKDLYLNQYHDPEDEPVCTQPLCFEFNELDVGEDEVRELIYREVLKYKSSSPSSDILKTPTNESMDHCSIKTTKEATKVNNQSYTISTNPNTVDKSFSVHCQPMVQNSQFSSKTTLASNNNLVSILDSASNYNIGGDEVNHTGSTNSTDIIPSCVNDEINIKQVTRDLSCTEPMKQMKPLKTVDYSVGGVTVACMQTWKISTDESKNVKKKRETNVRAARKKNNKNVKCATEAADGVNVKAVLRAALLNEKRDFRTKAVKLKEKKLKKSKNQSVEGNASKASNLSTEDKSLLERWQKMQPDESSNRKPSEESLDSFDNIKASQFLAKCVPILPKRTQDSNNSLNEFQRNKSLTDSNDGLVDVGKKLSVCTLTVRNQKKDLNISVQDSWNKNIIGTIGTKCDDVVEGKHNIDPCESSLDAECLNVEMQSASNSASLSDCGLDSSKLNNLVDTFIDPSQPLTFISSADSVWIKDLENSSLPTSSENGVVNSTNRFMSNDQDKNDLVISSADFQSCDLEQQLECKYETSGTLSAGSGYGIGVELDYSMEDEELCHITSGSLSASISQWLLTSGNMEEDLDSIILQHSNQIS